MLPLFYGFTFRLVAGWPEVTALVWFMSLEYIFFFRFATLLIEITISWWSLFEQTTITQHQQRKSQVVKMMKNCLGACLIGAEMTRFCCVCNCDSTEKFI